MTLELVPWRGAHVPLLARDEISRYSTQDYINWLTNNQRYMGAPMPVTTYGNRPAEPITNSFQGFVEGMLYPDGPVAAAEAYRLRVFGQAPILYQEIVDGRPGDLFDDEALDRLRVPWPGANIGDLMKRILVYGDFGGNGFILDLEDELVLVRPDWVEFVLAKRMYRGGQVGWKQVGIVYYEGGLRTNDGVPFLPGEYSHFVPGLPDPLANYRGMSWLTPLVREVQADKSAGEHKVAYFENAASPNLAVSLPKEITPTQFEAFVTAMDEKHKGARNAYSTLYTAGGADVTVIGANMQQMDFSSVIGKGETRIANAAGVPPTLLSFSEGMQGSSLNAGNYTAAKRNFVDTTMRDLWANFAGSLQQMDTFRPPREKTRLWYDGRDIPFLHEDAKDLAEIQQTRASTINSYITAGYKPETAVTAVAQDDVTKLEHTGLTSVQLMPPGSQDADGDGVADAEAQAGEDYEAALDEFRSELSWHDEIVRKFNPDQLRDWRGRWALDGSIIDALKAQGGEQDAAHFDDAGNEGRYVDWSSYDPSTATYSLEFGDGEEAVAFDVEDADLERLYSALSVTRLRDTAGATTPQLVALATLGETDAVTLDNGYIDWSTRTPAGDYGFGVESDGEQFEFDLSPAEMDKLIASLALSTQTRESVRSYIERRDYYDLRDFRGRFRKASDRIGHALNEWLKGNGDADDPLGDESEFSTASLRSAAKEFGITVPRARRGASEKEKRDQLKLALLKDARTRFRTDRDSEGDEPRHAKLTLSSPPHRDQDVGVYQEKSGKVSLYRESSTGQRGARIVSVDSLEALQQWGEEHSEPQVSSWAASERGVPVKKVAPRKAAPKKAARAERPAAKIPSGPATDLDREDQARVRRLIRRDPQIFATVHDRFGRVSTSGNLSNEDAAWLQGIYERDRAFVEHEAQGAELDRRVKDSAKAAGQSPAEYRAAASARLKEVLADKPIAVRVRDEGALRDILSGGRFKTQLEGARRAPGLTGDPDRRRLGESILGVPPDAPASERPVYGYVAVAGIEPALSEGRKTAGIREREGQEDVLSSYGKVQVVLRPEVRSRTTATVGDSLDEIGFLRPSPVDDPSVDSLGFRSLDRVTEPGFTRTGYVEAQIHGGIRTEDIAEVVFPDDPASATVAALERQGISWRILRPGETSAPTPAKKAAKKAAPPKSPAPSSDVTADLSSLRAMPTEARRDALDERKVDALKAMLRAEGLPVSGRKRELVDRLVAKMDGDGDGPPFADALGANGSYERRRQAVAEIAARRDLTVRPIVKGAQAETTVETAPDGSRIVRKAFRPGSEAKHLADAEELGPLVMAALDLPTPAATRVDDRTVAMEFADGQLGDEIVPFGQSVPASILDSNDARLIGLADYLTYSTDRNTGNWFRRPDGRLGTIDHADMFLNENDPYTPPSVPWGLWGDFGGYLRGEDDADGNPTLRPVVDVAPADLAQIRQRLAALRPEFAARRRLAWHRQMLRQLRELERRADPDAKPRLGRDAAPDTPAPVVGRDLHAGDAGAQLAADTVAERDRFVGRSRDPALSVIAERQGFDGLPEVASATEIERRATEAGTPVMLRGVQLDQESGKTPQQIMEDLRTGDAYFGRGTYGNGYYFGPVRGGSGMNNPRVFSRGRGALVHATYQPTARVIKMQELERQYDEYFASLGFEPARGPFQTPRNDQDLVFGDLGRFAASRGYDVVQMDHSEAGGRIPPQWLVLNRSVLIVEEAP